MPKTLQVMLDENYSNYNIEQSTFPGISLNKHLLRANSETENKLKEKKWDIIILQEHPRNFYYPEIVEEFTKPSIDKIIKLANNQNCKFILFKTWVTQKTYPMKYDCVAKSELDKIKYPKETNKEEYCSISIKDKNDDYRIIDSTINSIAKQFNFSATNHLNLHNTIHEKFPEISLYEDDGHPNENGSFLNALEFYSIITNKSPKKLKYIGNLDTETAEKLKNLF